MEEKRACTECESELYGRVDQRFCSDYCRNKFNNRSKRDTNNLVRNINNTLRKNRKILEALTPKEKSKTTRDDLLFKGFNFNYYTNTYTTKAGKIYYFCYDFGYLQLEEGEYALVRRKDYVK